MNKDGKKIESEFKKVFDLKVKDKNAIYLGNEEVEREYYKTGSLFYVKYKINYEIKGKTYKTDRVITFFHKNGELAYCFFYNNFVVEEYHKFNNEGAKTIEAKLQK